MEESQSVRIRASATYRAAGVPDLVLVLEEIVSFEDETIVRIEDRYDDEMKEEWQTYMYENGDTLGLALDG